MAAIELPSERIARLLKSGAWRYEQSVPCGPLAAMFVRGAWCVIHRASGRQVGEACASATAAVLFAGALLAMDVDWTAAVPDVTVARCAAVQARIEALL
jgi:hypothetical protein